MKKIVVLTFSLNLISNIIYAQWDGTSLNGNTYRNGNVGIGTTTPSSELEVKSVSGNDSEIHINAGSNGDQSIIRFQDAGSSTWGFLSNYPHSGKFSLYNYQSGSNALVLDTNGNLGIGITSPDEKLEVNGNILLEGDYYKFIQRRSNVSLEHIISGHGQGGGMMLNAEYSGSGNPQGNATFTLNPGTYNTSAGYLDFDGNGKRWSIFVSPSSSGIGNAVSFKELAFFDLNGGIGLSPSGNGTEFFINTNGDIGIGTSDPQSKLAVDGQIRATEVKVLAVISVPDYVFEENYELRTLKETKKYITENKHLPEIPSAAEIGKNGIDLGEMNMLLLKKIEELTLYQIELMERLEKVEGELQTLKN